MAINNSPATERPGRNGNVPPQQHRFKPGQSGNPGGRPKKLTAKRQIEALADEAVSALVSLMKNPSPNAIARLIRDADN